jgi:hypothetical protein
LVHFWSLVNRDITLDDVDTTYARYSAYRAQSISVINKQPNLIEIWERYKDLNKARIAMTSQDYLWKDVDRYLGKADDRLLELSKAQELLSYLLSTYAVSTIATMFRSALNPAINAAVNARLIEENPFKFGDCVSLKLLIVFEVYHKYPFHISHRLPSTPLVVDESYRRGLSSNCTENHAKAISLAEYSLKLSKNAFNVCNLIFLVKKINHYCCCF